MALRIARENGVVCIMIVLGTLERQSPAKQLPSVQAKSRSSAHQACVSPPTVKVTLIAVRFTNPSLASSVRAVRMQSVSSVQAGTSMILDA